MMIKLVIFALVLTSALHSGDAHRRHKKHCDDDKKSCDGFTKPIIKPLPPVIPECNSSPPRCGPNEHCTKCASACTPTCENPRPVCTKECITGDFCECKPGFVRHNGKCIKPCDCPKKTCGLNQVFSKCASACPPTCENPKPLCTRQCAGQKCVCKPGYLLHKGKCIKPRNCPRKELRCGKNEVASNCSECPRTCRNPLLVCKPKCTDKKEFCICQHGYLRHNGKCIKARDCPNRQCGPNEVFTDCASACPATCDKPKPFCTRQCAGQKCVCKPGFVRHNGKCIERSQCPNTRCGPHEVFTTCASACPGTCQNPNPICTMQCAGEKCVCKYPYVLHNGKCIDFKDCPQKEITCGKNEVASNCKECQRTCSNPRALCDFICTKKKEFCVCKPGYIRHNGVCIRERDCPNRQCGIHEVFTNCASACPPTCENPKPFCTKQCAGEKCVCKPGYVLHKGKCIKPCDCPRKEITCGKNEVASNCGECPRSCSNPFIVCRPICADEKKFCICKPGYIRHNGVCIKESDCPNRQCGINEVFTDCASACPPTCDNPNPICTKQCAGQKCVCKPGFVLHNGKCIKPCDCPPKEVTCGVNEVASQCPDCGKSCTNPFVTCKIRCSDRKEFCVCKPGYIRHNGVCIKECDCPNRQCGINEVFTNCASACPPTCENPNPVCTLQCAGQKCVCKPGFVLHNGKCIKPCDCPPKEVTCGVNEVASECAECPKTCSNPDIVCKVRCSDRKEFCNCKPGYIRHNGVCIRKCDCPNTRCGPNEVFTNCASACPPTCEDPNPVCTEQCAGSKCVCKPGYVLSEGKCIRPCDCPRNQVRCGENEVVTHCKPLCIPECGKPPQRFCPRICIPGTYCTCAPGTVLYRGRCIPQDTCDYILYLMGQGQGEACDTPTLVVDPPPPFDNNDMASGDEYMRRMNPEGYSNDNDNINVNFNDNDNGY